MGFAVSSNTTEDWRERLLERGLERCRDGDWDRGLEDLASVSRARRQKNLPGRLYSYLGYGIAKKEGNVEAGLRLCRHAVSLEFYWPENYLNLARTYLLAKDRQRACRAVEEGLKYDPQHPELQELASSFGLRRKPVVSFLSRNNFVNQILGRLRHAFTGPAN